jgi:hypothetical protein
MRDDRIRDAFASLVESYLRTDPPTTRLVIDDVEQVMDDLNGWHSFEGDAETAFHRFLWANNANHGRRMEAKTVEIREAILDLQDEYQQMTVRQIFYALTVRGIVPKTEAGGYVPVQRQVLALRRQGALPWAFIADGTRWVRRPTTYDSVEDALLETARLYRRNLWTEQNVRLEIWLEKDALASLISGTTYGWGVPLMVSRGQSSDTYCYAAGQEAKRAWEEADLETIVYALYDRDKSGRVAAEKIEEKLRTYSDDAPIEFTLLAVTDDQIEDWQLPTRPAKEKDEPDAVELDSITPDRLIKLVEDAITSHIDAEAWNTARAYEKSERDILKRIANTHTEGGS